MGLTQSVAPSAEPVSQADAKLHLRITGTDDDGYVDDLIPVARDDVESATGRQLITATWVWKLDAFPTGTELDVPRPPLQSITSITYIDANGDSQTLATSVYDVDTTSAKGRIALAYNQSWPATREDIEAVTITFVAGYGTAGSDLPPKLLHAVKMMVEHRYLHASPVSDRRKTLVPMTVENLLGPFDVRVMA